MRPNRNTKRYEDWYAKLLRLYPRGYRQRFAEPMQQMFGDMCREHRASGEPMFGFVLKVYADTGAAVIKECLKEVVMNTKTTRGKCILVAGVAGALVLIGGLAFILNNRPSSVIKPSSSLKQAREQSKGKKEACLSNSTTAASAVRADDNYIGGADEFSAFEMTGSEGIRDVPAGTNYEMTIHSYKDGRATGAVIYDKDYGKYNYVIKKLPKAGEWRFVSMVACK